MFVVCFVADKGGTGKTTMGLNYGAEAESRGHKTCIIDLDKQKSSYNWGEYRREYRTVESPEVLFGHVSRLPEMLHTAKLDGATLTILDTATNTPENEVEQATRASDLAIITCKPSLLEMRGITTTINAIRRTQTPAFILFNRVPTQGSRHIAAVKAVRSFDVPYVPHFVHYRIGFSHAYEVGQSIQEYEAHGKAAAEIRVIYNYIAKNMEGLQDARSSQL